MKKVLIGSKALQYYSLSNRSIKDVDYAVDDKQHSGKIGITEYLYNPIITRRNDEICSLNDLLTLKVSHVVGWDIGWDKHMWDIHKIITSKYDYLFDMELFNELYLFWNTIHEKNKRSNLDMSANDFFTNAIKYPIKHDDLHEMLIKHSHFKGQLTPTYCKILKDDSEVDVSEDKFNMLSFEEKLNLVQEEVMVMAMERSFHPDYRINYNIMLKKFILNHAPLWEAIFIIFNYPKLIKPFFNYKQFLNNE
jgi:hypothetical protein